MSYLDSIVQLERISKPNKKVHRGCYLPVDPSKLYSLPIHSLIIQLRRKSCILSSLSVYTLFFILVLPLVNWLSPETIFFQIDLAHHKYKPSCLSRRRVTMHIRFLFVSNAFSPILSFPFHNQF